MTEANSQRIVIALPPTLREQVARLADRDSVSLSAITRRALKQFVQECTSIKDRRGGKIR